MAGVGVGSLSMEKDLGGIADEGKSDLGNGNGNGHDGAFVKPQSRKIHDPAVSFEEYVYYAQKTRAEQDATASEAPKQGFMALMFPTKSGTGAELERERKGSEIAQNVNLSNRDSRAVVTDEEWTNASRALRTATTGAIFYLITTDILGPFGLPYAFASMGWGPGVALFTVFAALAGYSGYLLWTIFMDMDSYEFPIKNFGDLGYRVFGQPVRYIFNILQSIQLLLNVGIIVISNGEALSQAAKFKLCFAICCLIWALAGFFLGQIRTLQKFGWLANAAVWINIICMIITMAAAAHSLPNYIGSAASAGAGYGDGVSVTPDSSGNYPPVMHSNGLPTAGDFGASVNGAMQAVYSYGGSMIFPEFMAEMRRPRDFLKAMWFSQLFIYVVYMFYGLFMYAYQGQYVINPSYLGISTYGAQTAGNVFAMLSALIAAALYGNIGVKVLYNNVFVEIFRAPSLSSRSGKFFWVALIPVYWTIAFIIAAGIPDFPGLTGVVAALCILQFTYSFPPLLSVGFMIQRYAMTADEGFDPATGQTVRRDGGFKRIMRGFMGYRWYMNVFNILYCLGSLCLAALGAYGAINNLIAAFASGTTNSFVCKSPLQ